MHNALPKTTKPNRFLALAFLVSFSLSLLFPIIASIVNKKGDILVTAGIFDVSVAAICVSLFVLLYKRHAKALSMPVIIKSQKAAAYICTAPLVLISIYFAGPAINWPVLLIGLGWRFWLLISALPYVFAAFEKN